MVASGVESQIMYIELTGPGHRTEWARIGRVTFSKTGKTIYYDGRCLLGMGRAWYRDEQSGDRFWIQRARPDGMDRFGKHKRGSLPIAIDEDVRQEYWCDVRRDPGRAHERIVHG
jgi:hypothetical protein